MKYFAYGSNMSLARLRARTPSAISLGHHVLSEHQLRFHKRGMDGSAKCDAFFTGQPQDCVHGVLFEIDDAEKPNLDRAEGLGYGYDEKVIEVRSPEQVRKQACTYVATKIDETRVPFHWYKDHVLLGARAAQLPAEYVDAIENIETIEDPNAPRALAERAVQTRKFP
jgi:gamma-glutamylcyclotransferase